MSVDNKSKFIKKMVALFPTLCELILWGSECNSSSYMESSDLLEELKLDKEKTIKKHLSRDDLMNDADYPYSFTNELKKK